MGQEHRVDVGDHLTLTRTLEPAAPTAAGSDHRSNARLIEVKAGVETELADAGRVLIRASGTEPVLRVMVEARDGPLGRRCADRIAEAAAKAV